MKGLLIVVGFITLLGGCTSSYVVSKFGGADSLSYEQFNGDVEGNEVRMELADGRQIKRIHLTVSNDSARWIDASSDSTHKLATAEIKQVIRKNHALGGLKGFGYGFIAGAVPGGILGSSTGAISFAGSQAPFEFAAILGLPLGVIGGIIGLVNGQKYEYGFSKKDSTRK